MTKTVDELQYDYEYISEEIKRRRDQERDKILEEVILLMRDRGDDTDGDDSQNTYGDISSDFPMTMIVLLGIHISLALKIKRIGYSVKSGDIEQDIQQFLEQMRDYARQGSISDYVINYARNWLYVVNKGYEAEVDAYLPKKKPITRFFRNINTKEFDELKGLLYLETGVESLAYGFEEEGTCLLLAACEDSAAKQTAKEHMEFINMILGELAAVYPPVTIRICQKYESVFTDQCDIQTGIFLLYYGDALMTSEDYTGAKEILKRCVAVREEIAEQGTWFVDIARRDYATVLFSVSKGKEGYEEIQRFVINIEEGKYSEIDNDILKVIEGQSLYSLLMIANRIFLPEEAEYYFEIYEKLCGEVKIHPIVNMRTFYVRKACYCFYRGLYTLAENYFLKALSVPLEEGIVTDTSDISILCDLLMIYYIENDIDHCVELLNELFRRRDEDELSFFEQVTLVNLAVSIESRALGSIKCIDSDGLKETIDDVFGIVRSELRHGSREERNAAVALVSSMNWLRNSNRLSEEELNDCLEKILWIQKNVLLHHEEKEFRLEILNALAIFSFECKKDWYIKIFDREIPDLDMIRNSELKAEFCFGAALCYLRSGREEEGLKHLFRFFDEIENYWHKSVCYMNDARLIQLLLPAQAIVMNGYTLLKEMVTAERSYEYVLKFKEMSSLAGRERNRCIRRGMSDNELLIEIRALQNKREMLSSGILSGVEEYDYEQNELQIRELENIIAEQFDQIDDFIEISVQNVFEQIPEDSVVIEYFHALDKASLRYVYTDYDSDHTVFDIYFIHKKNGECTLHRKTIKNTFALLEIVEKFLTALQAQSDDKLGAKQAYDMNDQRRELYQKLILPIDEYLIGVKNVYIAPDSLMVNLPFSCLQNEDGEYFGDKYQLTMIECARDFLFGDKISPPGEGSVIIGNPAFEITRSGDISEQDNPLKRAGGLTPKDIIDLPGTELELKSVSNYLHSDYHSGKNAIKKYVLSAEGKRNIHIATHGYYDFYGQCNSLYSSFLMFAGIKDWMIRGKTEEPYGNGVLTADEVSRLQLQSVDLTVLSACVSGMNDVTVSAGFRGLTGAFSAAGVKYVVSSLWQVDDQATAILMDKFYEGYVSGMKPPVALQHAKQYVRNVSVGELKRAGWINEIGKSDDVVLYAEERYWAAFVCYQCNAA